MTTGGYPMRGSGRTLSGRDLIAVTAATVFIVTGAASAGAGRPRPVEIDPPAIDQSAVEARRADPGYIDREPTPSAEAIAEARRLAVAEADLVAAETRALATPAAATLPAPLGTALTSAPDLAADALSGLHLARVRDDGGFQEATNSGGGGTLFVSWQRWPENVDPCMFVTEFATIDRAGDLDFVIEDVDLPGVQMRSVRVFDGDYLIAVSGYNVTRLDIAAVRRLAEAVYRGITEDA